MDPSTLTYFTYFNTHLDLNEEKKLQIASLQLEGLAQIWWDTQLENQSFFIELDENIDPPM